jgi:hypothetical protein
MTDTLKPAELDLEALKKVALEATPGPWTLDEEWIQYEGMLRPSHNIYSAAPSPDGRIICNVDIWRHDPEGTHENARHIATFSPATALSLLTRIEALEAERDEKQRALAVAGETLMRLDRTNADLGARALSAEAQRDRMREALTALRNRVYQRIPSERWHLFQQAVENADAALAAPNSWERPQPRLARPWDEQGTF